MELGDPTTDERAERSALDVALDTLDNALNGLLDTVQSGGLEQLNAAEKISFWQQFETFRNRLPLIDHNLIADAEASDLAGEYNFNNLTRFLMRIFLLSHSEAAARVRAAAAVGPRSSMLGERLQPLLPKLAAVQRDGAVTAERVQIVERAMRYALWMLLIPTAQSPLMINCNKTGAMWTCSNAATACGTSKADSPQQSVLS